MLDNYALACSLMMNEISCFEKVLLCCLFYLHLLITTIHFHGRGKSIRWVRLHVKVYCKIENQNQSQIERMVDDIQ